VAIGRERLLVVMTRGTRAAAVMADRWRLRLAEALKRHQVFAEILDHNPSAGLGGLVAGIADVSDCAGPAEAFARADVTLESARKGAGPLAVWLGGRPLGLEDYLARTARLP
jgi:hypothetical protein